MDENLDNNVIKLYISKEELISMVSKTTLCNKHQMYLVVIAKIIVEIVLSSNRYLLRGSIHTYLAERLN